MLIRHVVSGALPRQGMGIPEITGKPLVTVSTGENQRSEQEMRSLVPALPLNMCVSLDKSLSSFRKEFSHPYT